ncbi:MAG: hypothetical protein WC982_11500 [Advenella sp.]
MSSDPCVAGEGRSPLLHQPHIQSSLKAHVAQVLRQRTCSDTLLSSQTTEADFTPATGWIGLVFLLSA